MAHDLQGTDKAARIGTLSEKEKETLRLIVRGHDAKSSANALDLSVHTINERLRNARRKLDVTSSKEAARMLLDAEGPDPNSLGDMELGDAQSAVAMAEPSSATPPGWWAKHRLVFIAAGVLSMSLLFAALLIPQSPLAVLPAGFAATSAATEEAQAEQAAIAAEDFLELLDQGNWEESYAATAAEFRRLNTLQVWTDISEKVRTPLGKNLTRDLIVNEYVPAPPNGYQMVKFSSSYANGASQTETITLAWEDGAWRVAGIVVD